MFSQKINGFLFGSNGKWNLISTLFSNTKYTCFLDILIYLCMISSVFVAEEMSCMKIDDFVSRILPRIQRQSTTKLHETNFQQWLHPLYYVCRNCFAIFQFIYLLSAYEIHLTNIYIIVYTASKPFYNDFHIATNEMRQNSLWEHAHVRGGRQLKSTVL